MIAVELEDEPLVLHCILELRAEGEWCRGLVRVKENGRVLFDEWVATRALIASLLGNTQEPVMTCSCTVPECAGFYDQESRLSENLIHWSLRYEGKDLDLLFDRNAYEDAALAVLKHFRSHPWKDAEFGTVPYEYKEFKDFSELVDNMLASSLRLAERWRTIPIEEIVRSPEPRHDG